MKKENIEFRLTYEEIEYLYNHFLERKIIKLKKRIKRAFIKQSVEMAEKNYIINDTNLYDKIKDKINKFSDLINIKNENESIFLEFIEGEIIVIPFRAFEINNIEEVIEYLLRIVNENKKQEIYNPRSYKDNENICIENVLTRKMYGALKLKSATMDRIQNRNRNIKKIIFIIIMLGFAMYMRIYSNIKSFELEHTILGNMVLPIYLILGIFLIFLKLKIDKSKAYKLSRDLTKEIVKYSIKFTSDEVITQFDESIEHYKLENVINLSNMTKNIEIKMLVIQIDENKIKKIVIPGWISMPEYKKEAILKRISKSVKNHKNKNVMNEMEKFNKKVLSSMFIIIIIGLGIANYSISIISEIMPVTYKRIESVRMQNIENMGMNIFLDNLKTHEN